MIAWLRKLLDRAAQSHTGTLSAGEVTPTPDIDNAKSTRSRADVRQELDQARAHGQAPDFGEATSTPEFDRGEARKSRAQVKSELDEYIRSGQRDRDRGETQTGG